MGNYLQRPLCPSVQYQFSRKCSSFCASFSIKGDVVLSQKALRSVSVHIIETCKQSIPDKKRQEVCVMKPFLKPFLKQFWMTVVTILAVVTAEFILHRILSSLFYCWPRSSLGSYTSLSHTIHSLTVHPSFKRFEDSWLIPFSLFAMSNLNKFIWKCWSFGDASTCLFFCTWKFSASG